MLNKLRIIYKVLFCSFVAGYISDGEDSISFQHGTVQGEEAIIASIALAQNGAFIKNGVMEHLIDNGKATKVAKFDKKWVVWLNKAVVDTNSSPKDIMGGFNGI